MSTLQLKVSRTTENSVAEDLKMPLKVSALKTKTTSKIPLTLHFGNLQKRVSLIGNHLGAKAVPVGILSALQ